MSNIIKETKKEITKLHKMICQVNDFLHDAPPGCLKYQNKGPNTYFYQQYMDQNKKQWARRYIKKENVSLAGNLAQKQYYIAIKPMLEKNLQALKKFEKEYNPEAIEKIYLSLSDERKKLIKPLKNSKEELIKEWYEEKYEINTSYPENLRFETEQGELVRSKSEVIISNILFQHKNDILYKYERPLHVLIDRKIKTIHPDFTILNIHTGRIVYWEHAGRMDDSGYADDFVKKVNIYISNNIIPGRDVFFTYESVSYPLDISVVKKLVEEILRT